MAALLAVAILPLPYGFYTFLRLVVCVVSAGLAYWAFRSRGLHWTTIVPGLLALLFNPMVPVRLTRGVRLPINLLGAAFYVYLRVLAPKLFSPWPRQ